MSDLIEILKKFNRKERFFLIGQAVDGSRVVRRCYSDCGVQLSNSALVSYGQAACAHSMGAHSRPAAALRLPSATVYRYDCRTGPDHRVVRVALADRGYLSGGTGPPGSGDSTPVVGSRHSPDHPCAFGTVLLDNSRGPPAVGSKTCESTQSSLVCQV